MVQQHEGKWYVADADERLIGGPFESAFEAEVNDHRLSSPSQHRILEDIKQERVRQNARTHSTLYDQPDGTFLAILTKKVGDAASTLVSTNRKRDLRQELVEVCASGVAWLEEIERRAT